MIEISSPQARKTFNLVVPSVQLQTAIEKYISSTNITGQQSGAQKHQQFKNLLIIKKQAT